MTAERRSPPFPGFGIVPKAASEGHRCEGDLPKAAYGDAIRYCFEGEDGKLWITNEEYASQVNFCPYCGYKAAVAVEKVKSR